MLDVKTENLTCSSVNESREKDGGRQLPAFVAKQCQRGLRLRFMLLSCIVAVWLPQFQSSDLHLTEEIKNRVMGPCPATEEVEKLRRYSLLSDLGNA